jgi:hypothetical protein
MGEQSRRIVVKSHNAEQNLRQLIEVMLSSFENSDAFGGCRA